MTMAEQPRRWTNFNLYVANSDILKNADHVAIAMNKSGASRSSVICAACESVFNAVLKLAEDGQLTDEVVLNIKFSL